MQIVCGAPNVDAGKRVVVIKPGDVLPAVGGKGALKIKVGKIRGVESHGMICSESELGLSDEADGIFVLPALAENTSQTTPSSSTRTLRQGALQTRHHTLCCAACPLPPPFHRQDRGRRAVRPGGAGARARTCSHTPLSDRS